MQTPRQKYTLYLDASGDSGWVAPNGTSKFKYYVLGGLIVTPEQESQMIVGYNMLMEKHFSLPLSKPFELKYTYITSSVKEPFKLMTEEQKKALADDVFKLIINLNPILIATIVDKERLKNRYGIGAYNPTHYALRATAVRFSMTLKGLEGIGEIIMDEDKTDLQTFLSRARRGDLTIRGWRYNPRYSEFLEPIINSLLSTKSEDSVGIQLADFVVKTLWFKYVYDKGDRFSQIEPLFFRLKGRRVEPSVVPA